MLSELRPLALLPLLAVAACAATPSDSAAPDSIPFLASETIPATTAPPLDAGTSAGESTADAADPTAGMDIDTELLAGMLATEQGRALIVQGLADQAGLDPADASCFIDDIDPATIVALSELGAGGLDPTALPPEALADLQGAVATCGIPLDALLG